MNDRFEHFADTFFRRSADTAHDLKTPLNVAVLNLELLRMRLRKLLDEEDPKVAEYASSLEVELRRMAAIFDSFFTYAAPPRNAPPVEPVDLGTIVRSQVQSLGPVLEGDSGKLYVSGHEPRIRDLLRLFLEAASRLFKVIESLQLLRENSSITLRVAGELAIEEVAAEKAFKFYYSDSSGNPDLRLASARLIAETYGGRVELTAAEDGWVLELTLPSGE